MAKDDSGKKKLTSRLLRERLGAVPKEPVELSREHAAIKKRLREALADGPKTVPELAATVQMPTRQVFWHLMSMKKYGGIVEGEERDSYMEYRLAAKGDK
ncbi:hypothetical protein JW905_07960 [bacterium]|nr:hypothetical protein [candidate division CSSED10-310 bacterium]